MDKKLYLFLLLFLPVIAYPQGTISPSNLTVCYGNNSGQLTLSGTGLPIKRWEMSYTGNPPWISISVQTSTLDYTNLTTTAKYRAIVQNGGIEGASSVALITVSPQAIGGSITGESQVCSGVNEGDLKLTSYQGNILKWQYSYDNIVWMDTAALTSALHYKNINRKTYFSAVVQSGGACATVNPVSFIIDASAASNAGSAFGAATVCEGNNSGAASITGQTGNIVRWESSPTGYDPWNSIANKTSSIAYKDLVQTTFYHAVVQNGICLEAASPLVLIQVDKRSVGGNISSDAGVCSKTNVGNLSLNGYLGTINKWQYSDNGGGLWNDTTVTNASFTYQMLTKTRIYRAEVKNGVCSLQMSSLAKITVYPLPAVSFNAPDKPQGEAVHFVNSSTIASGSISKYIYDFGDGSFSINASPSHIFDNYGIYKVKLEATTDKGCMDSVLQNIEIFNVPKVDFVYSNICLKGQASFLNTSIASDPTVTYLWDFGDGSPTSADKDPVHKYTISGSYYVILTVTTPNATSSKTKPIEVYPQAQPAFTAGNVCLGNNTIFFNQSSINGGYLSYGFDFGDGRYQSSELNPVHSYASDGAYLVKLVTTTNNNCLDTIYKTIYVHPRPKANFSATNVPFGFPVVFSDSSIYNGSLYYQWNFGDSDTSKTKNPVHTYISAGNYPVDLTISTDSGCMDNTSKTVWVYPKPHADFTFKPVCVYDSISFENLTTISFGTLHYIWTMGKEGISNTASPRWKFSTPGVHQIRLIAISGNNGQDTITKTVEIYPQPVSSFDAPNVCDGYSVIFTNTSSVSGSSITNYIWDFGDGSNAIRQSPTRLYLNPGDYAVSLKTISNYNCEATSQKIVTVYQNPTANFTATNVCHGRLVSFINLGVASYKPEYSWEFGDSTVSDAVAPGHLYRYPGAWPVKLKVTTGVGCSDSLKRNVIVYTLPPVNAGKDTIIALGFPAMLHGSGGSMYSWTPPLGLSSPYMDNPYASPTITTVYTLTVQDENGCINADSVKVTVEDTYKIIISNVVTPDGNGKNDYWHIQNIENYPRAEVVVMDRWGKIVLKTKSYQNNWDGRNGNNDILPDGAYFYVITIPGSTYIYKGNINILRNK